MKILLTFISLIAFSFSCISQTYPDYIGAGHETGVTIYVSDENSNDLNTHVISGAERVTDFKAASRFLGQATFGSNYNDIITLANSGITQWIDNQLAMPVTENFYTKYITIFNEIAPQLGPNSTIELDEFLIYSFYQKIMNDEDALRQKMAFALSQIFVISPPTSTLGNRGFANSIYYDLLYEGAFGNYRDLLMNVTMSSAMGIYLSHFQNSKEDLGLGISPDENFAREIMQLFSIGLHELNNDGSLKLDQNAEIIPSYTNFEIQQMSRIFTGLSGNERLDGNPALFTFNFGVMDLTLPMKMYDEYHDVTEKNLLDGSIIMGGQSGMDDINTAIDFLFNHPNVGPFIGTRLIQQFVKSNPSPAYINRVASAFNSNTNGIRGDMSAVLRAVLLDPEARDCSLIDDPKAGRLKQPIERMTNLFLGFNLSTPSGKFWFRDVVELRPKVEQSFLAAPTVFNFFTPFYAEAEFVEPNDMVSPEFQILNSTSGIHYLNIIENALKNRPFGNRTAINTATNNLTINSNDQPAFNFTAEIAEYNNNGLSSLIDRIDLILCHGQLSSGTKAIVTDAINQNINNAIGYDTGDIINDVIYYIMLSPDYMIIN